MRFLIVEDVPEMREWLGSLLSTHFSDKFSDLKISLADSPVELRRQLERAKPDLILLDEVLGVDTNEDLASVLSGLLTHRVVLMTGMETANMGKRVLPPHVLGRLIKPSWDQGGGEEGFLKGLEQLLTDLG